MSPSEIARIDAACAAFEQRLRLDPQFACYLDERAASERRRLGLPVLVTRADLAERAWEDEQAERRSEAPLQTGVPA